MNPDSPIGRSGAPVRPPPAAFGLNGLAGVLIIGAGIYLARDVLVPLALAILLTFALAPAVGALRRLRIARTPAVIGVVACAFGLIFAFGALVTSQVASLAQDLPTYQRNVEGKILSLRGMIPGDGLIERTATMIHELGRELTEAPVDTTKSRRGQPKPAASAPKPMPVEIWQPDPTPLEVVQRIVSPLLPPLATGGLILLLVTVMLLHREDLRNRVIGLLGAHDLTRVTHALDDAASRVSRYLVAQTAINAGFGFALALGLATIGVPNALLWGLLGMLLRFVPYIGAALASIAPVALAIAIDPGWTLLAWTAAFYIALETTISYLVEPWLYGGRTGLSPIAVIFAAVVWTWLWGPIGLLLSTPLTVCLVVMGRHVPQLAFLDTALGSEPALSAPERHYQRLIAGDPDEATEQAEHFLAQHDDDLLAFYDGIGLPALALAARDRARGMLDNERLAVIADSAFDVIENLAHRGESRRHRGATSEAQIDPTWRDGTVLCVAARTSLDEAVAAILAQLLARRGFVTRVVPSATIGPRALGALDLEGVKTICLSYLDPSATVHARYLAERLRRRAGTVPLFAGVWAMSEADDARDVAQKRIGADGLATTLAEMVALVEQAPSTIAPIAALRAIGP